MNSDKCLWYRCRQCAAVFPDIAEASGETIPRRLLSAANDGAESPWLYSVHACELGSLGLFLCPFLFRF